MTINDQLNKIELRLKNFSDEKNKEKLLKTISKLLITMSNNSEITSEVHTRINQIQENIRTLEAGLNETHDEGEKKQSVEEDNNYVELSFEDALAIGENLEDGDWEIIESSNATTLKPSSISSSKPSSIPSSMPSTLSSTGYIEFSGNIFQKGNFHDGDEDGGIF